MMYLKKALRGTVIIFILSLLGGLFGYLTRVILARNLTIAEFGLFYSVMTIFLFMSYMVDAGLGYAASRKIVEFNVKGKINLINNLLMSVATIQFAVSLIIGGLLLILNNFLSVNYFHADASLLIILGVLWSLILPVLAIYIGIFSGFQKPEYSVVLDTTKSLMLLLFSFLFIILGYSYISPALAYLVTNILLMIIFYFLAKKIFSNFKPCKFKYNHKLAMQTSKFGLIVGLSNFIWLIILQIDTMLITYFLGTESVGIYQVAITVAYLLLYLTTAVSLVLYPMINELNFKKQRKTIIQGINLVYKYLLILLVPAVIILFSFPDIFINLLFTSKYLSASSPLRILAIFTIFCSITSINNLLLVSLGKPQRVVKIMLIIAITNFILNFITIPIWGITGAAYSTLISFILATLISSYELRKIINVRFPFLEWFLLTGISLIMLLEVHFLMKILHQFWIIKLILIMLIILSTYVVLLFLLRILSIEEIKNFVKLFFSRL